MPDPPTPLRASHEQTGPGRVCPSCGRRVPRTVSSCRCGTALPADAFPAAAATPEESRGTSNAIIALIIGALLLAGAGYWLFLRPAPDATLAEVEVDEETVADDAAPAGPSAAARAWDAAANAKEEPPTKLEEPPIVTAPPSPVPMSASTEEMVDRVM